ncbi:MAG: hypothetical protein KDA41_04095, partial [Planctomycetales bacterium]|nr:hypothetical protein [Planctomycetales bacterium]
TRSEPLLIHSPRREKYCVARRLACRDARLAVDDALQQRQARAAQPLARLAAHASLRRAMWPQDDQSRV